MFYKGLLAEPTQVTFLFHFLYVMLVTLCMLKDQYGVGCLQVLSRTAFKSCNKFRSPALSFSGPPDFHTHIP